MFALLRFAAEQRRFNSLWLPGVLISSFHKLLVVFPDHRAPDAGAFRAE
jgi:hypothetical protein